MDDFNDLNLNTADPLAQMDNLINATKIHIRITKRNARKCICTIEGLEFELSELKQMLKAMKKKFACNGSIEKDEKFGNILQLQGDIREQAKDLLVKDYNILEENIITHGYD
tara:strand:+ start:185 stop:520 length:336 start_codon:yes stop_codon:yes gene_type:complete